VQVPNTAGELETPPASNRFGESAGQYKRLPNSRKSIQSIRGATTANVKDCIIQEKASNRFGESAGQCKRLHNSRKSIQSIRGATTANVKDCIIQEKASNRFGEQRRPM